MQNCKSVEKLWEANVKTKDFWLFRSIESPQHEGALCLSCVSFCKFDTSFPCRTVATAAACEIREIEGAATLYSSPRQIPSSASTYCAYFFFLISLEDKKKLYTFKVCNMIFFNTPLWNTCTLWLPQSS